MKNFTQFELENASLIFGGAIEYTYVGINGDLYDTEKREYYFIEGPLN